MKNKATQIEVLGNSSRDIAALPEQQAQLLRDRTHITTGVYYTILMATYYFEIIFINFALR